ncbi:uncharacterized protein LOC110467019 [Mizuhopecten yessoensis]|uniref:Uncharacterized protein n=1 Tax=Mizuhopecten yessoensis TaxID=6573 RepID=A0A210PMW7_MIZYE|nr:uncharacterized protein LOC110467019 [Mizuhopecten yessoensis]OWF37804.1 hypothetical protein KP79_PYT06003 [Mizuhopecten yessoensis]
MEIMTPLDSGGGDLSQQFDISADGFSYIQGADTKNIKIKQYLCVRDSLPKTALSHVILNENMSQDRQLERTMSDLTLRQLKQSNANDLTQRTFVAVQDRKQKKWKRDDETRLSNMNFPMFSVPEERRPKEMDVVYRLPDYRVKTSRGPRLKSASAGIGNGFGTGTGNGNGNGTGSGYNITTSTPRQVKMPFGISKETTEIITHNDKTFMNKLPEVEVIDHDALKHYDTYRGKTMLESGTPSQDMRFKRLENLLNPVFLKQSDQYNEQNVKSKSRLSKYSGMALEDRERVDDEKHPGDQFFAENSFVAPSIAPSIDQSAVASMSGDFAQTVCLSAPPSVAQAPPSRVNDQAWMITRLNTVPDFKAKPASSRSRLAQDQKMENAKKRVKRSVEILESFRNGDVNKLAKTLAREKKKREEQKKATIESCNKPP